MDPQALEEPTTGLLGATLGGRFLIEKLLSAGGMGLVWLAHDQQLDRKCVVKTLRSAVAQDASTQARFVREARAAAALGSRHVVAFFAADVDPGDETRPPIPFLAMELLDGMDVEERLRRGGPIPVGETILLLRQVARALDKAHSLGIVHRDIKPENIFVTQEDGETVAKVLDFGIAKLLAERAFATANLTRTGALLGSPLYMAPEQFDDAAVVDRQTDYWALALVAYRMLTGLDFWKSHTLPSLVAEVCHGEIPRASERSGGLLPATADSWFSRALRKNPAERFGSAVEMVEVLSGLLGGLGQTGHTSIPSSLELLPTAIKGDAPDSVVEVRVSTERATLEASGAGITVPTQPSAARPKSQARRSLWIAAGSVATLFGLGVAGWSLTRQAPTQGFSPGQLSNSLSTAMTATQETSAFSSAKVEPTSSASSSTLTAEPTRSSLVVEPKPPESKHQGKSARTSSTNATPVPSAPPIPTATSVKTAKPVDGFENITRQ